MNAAKQFALSCAFVLCCLFCSESRAVDRSWLTPAGGIYNVTGNWSGGVVPTSSDTGIFALNQPGGYTVTMNSGTTSGGMTLRNEIVTFNPSGFTLTLSGAAAGLTLGDQSGNNARLSIGGGTVATTIAKFATASSSTGIGTINSGGVLTCSGLLTVGSTAAGSLTINSGGVLTTTSSTFICGGSTTSTGNITVTGAGANWTASGTIFVGDGGTGTLAVSNSGVVTAASLILSTLSGPTPSGKGTLVVSNNGSFTVSAPANIGSLGTGSLLVSSGGRGASTAGIVFGSNSDGIGIGSISGGGGWTNTGSLQLGSNGFGSLVLDSSGTFSTTTSILGGTPTAIGQLLVSNSAHFTNTGTMSIGSNGAGSMTINSSGLVTTAGVTLGTNSGSTGAVTLGGAGSQLNNTGSLVIGAAGAGALSVLSAADMTSAGATIASGSGVTGTALVQGTSSTWVNSGSIVLGGSGFGSLDVLSGASVTTNGMNIGNAVGSTGALTIAGGASLVDSPAGSIFVGGGSLASGGSGVVNVQPGAKLNVGPNFTLRVHNTGSVNLSGGTISTGALQVNNGGAFNFNSGTLIITGSLGLDIDTGAPLGGNLQLNSGQNLSVTNNATISFGAFLNMNGGNLSANFLTNSGELLLSDRTSLITTGSVNNQGLITGDGRITGTIVNSSAILTGEIRADAGHRLTFSNGMFLSNNSGLINLFGGTIEFDGLTNNPSGRITGRGVLSCSSGLINNGQITFSAGTTDMLGSLTNNFRTTVTGSSISTFFSGVTNNGGSEFRVSTGATAVFLGFVSGLSQFTGGGTKIFEAGASFGALETSGNTIVESSGDLLADHVRENSLTIFGFVTIEPNGTLSGTSNVKQLTIAGGATPTGTLELNDNALVIDHSGASPLSTIAAQIKFAYHGGAWDRPGITSSLADATTHAIGFAERSILGGAVPAIFGAVDSDAVLVRYTRYGDADLNGTVNLADFNRLAGNFGVGNTWLQGDFNYDGMVNLIDFNFLAANFGLAASPDGPTPHDWAALAAAVPEPATSLLLIGGLAASAARRRRIPGRRST